MIAPNLQPSGPIYTQTHLQESARQLDPANLN